MRLDGVVVAVEMHFIGAVEGTQASGVDGVSYGFISVIYYSKIVFKEIGFAIFVYFV